MELLELINKLMTFRSISADKKISANCIDFIINYIKNTNNVFIKPIKNNGYKSVLISNVDTLDFDVLEAVHIDVVPVNDDRIFEPRMENNILYGRGGADMKAFVAVSIKSLEYVIKNNIKIKYGILIVSDEEIGGFNGAQYWSNELGLKSKIVLDSDTGKKLNTVIYKSKAPFFFRLISNGKTSHGSRPWLSENDAIENLIITINKLRKIFPHYCAKNSPDDKWIETMHVGLINGGKAANVIADYAEAKIDMRFTEKYTINSLHNIVKENLVDGVDVKVEETGKVVFSDENNKYIKLYSEILEGNIKEKVLFDFATGAADSAHFSGPNTIIIGNQADCGELHADGEWINFNKLKDFANVKKEFLIALSKEF